MPVHLYGSVVDINLIKESIKRKNILIIDDCSQAHGAKFGNKKVGSLADISCFSLYPGKNLGAYGDAGIITTNNQLIFKKIKNFRNLGSDKKFIHDQIGFNSRLDTIQAAVLLRKLPFLNTNNKKRINRKYYSKYINNKKLKTYIFKWGCLSSVSCIIKKKINNKFVKKNNIPIIFTIQNPYINLKLLKIFLKMRSTKTQKELPVKV